MKTSTARTRGYLGGFCLVTDSKASGISVEEMTLRALEGGARWIQYREKDKTRRELYREALRLREMTTRFRAVFIVNDHADIALAVDADGVHLGQDDLPLIEARRLMKERIIGISTHALAEAVDAEQGGADYIGFGPVFHTATKDAGSPRGLDMVREIRERVHIPVVAIGGISMGGVPSVLEAGADAVAVASAVSAGDITENVKSFLALLAGEFHD